MAGSSTVYVTVKRYMAQYRRTGSLAPKPPARRLPRIGPAEYPALRAQLAAAPAATLAEHCATWEQTHGVHISVPTLYRAIRAVDWTRKKVRDGERARPGSPGRVARRDRGPRPHDLRLCR